jgi:hypothetical protein
MTTGIGSASISTEAMRLPPIAARQARRVLSKVYAIGR